MPATRRSTRGAAAAAKDSTSKQQSTLSFNHRVTKGNATKAGKDAKLTSPAPAKAELPAREEVKVVELEEQQPEEVAPPAQQEPAAEKTEAQARAEEISDAQIKRYWKGVEDARTARRVHQEELGLPEKVLRYFDVSSQYGVSYRFRILSVQPVICLPNGNVADNAAALHRSPSHETVVPSRAAGSESANRGPSCAAERGESGEQRDRSGCY